MNKYLARKYAEKMEIQNPKGYKYYNIQIKFHLQKDLETVFE